MEDGRAVHLSFPHVFCQGGFLFPLSSTIHPLYKLPYARYVGTYVHNTILTFLSGGRWYQPFLKNRPRKNNPMPMFPSAWAQFTSNCCFFWGGLPECQTHSRPIFASFATRRGQKRFYFIPFSPQPPKIFDRQFFLPPSLPAKEEM